MLRADNMLESTVQTWTEHGSRADKFQNFFLERYAAAYKAEIAHFADILAGRSESLVSFAEGVAALAWRTPRRGRWRQAFPSRSKEYPCGR